MAIAWFIAPYVRRVGAVRPQRYCSMDDFTTQILADAGDWHESEVLGNRAVVKVRATSATLNTIAADARMTRVPLAALDNPLSSLTTNQRSAIRNAILDAGYTVAEVNARFPNLANNTLGDVLRFLATRRLKARFDQPTDSIVLDGEQQACRSIDDVDQAVQ